MVKRAWSGSVKQTIMNVTTHTPLISPETCWIPGSYRGVGTPYKWLTAHRSHVAGTFSPHRIVDATFRPETWL